MFFVEQHLYQKNQIIFRNAMLLRVSPRKKLPTPCGN
jgi:hypothetical protein